MKKSGIVKHRGKSEHAGKCIQREAVWNIKKIAICGCMIKQTISREY
jgi:hypothetical protein